MELLAYASEREVAAMRAMGSMAGNTAGNATGAEAAPPLQLSTTPSEEIYAKAAAIQRAIQQREAAKGNP